MDVTASNCDNVVAFCILTVGCAVPYTAIVETGAVVPIPNVLTMRMGGRYPFIDTRLALI